MGENILLLLIGGNPLPNYVTADYLLKEERDDKNELPIPGRIFLVHSKNTGYLAEKIEDKIKSKYHSANFEMIDIKDGERNGNLIMEEISEKLKSQKKDESGINSVHLNYTGGTKPMAAFGCMAVDKFCRENEIKQILSDLDPGKFQISVAETERSYPNTGNLLGKVELSVKDIFELHNMEIKKEGSDSLTFSKDLLDLNDFVKEAVPKFDVKNPHTGWFEKVRTEIKGNWSKLKQFDFSAFKENKKKDGKNVSEVYNSITDEFPSLKNFFENNKFKESLGDKTGKDFVAFFTGKWLEDYVLLTLQNLKKNDIYDLRKGAEASYNGVRTEIDVIAMKGYQMFLFTVTTSQKIGLVKEKAFEGIYRAEQLGGEHAKVISVSLMPNSSIETLKTELREFRASKKCHCVGFDEISDEINGKQTLSEKFRKIING